jgi:hypothetical protein
VNLLRRRHLNWRLGPLIDLVTGLLIKIDGTTRTESGLGSAASHGPIGMSPVAGG